MILGTFVKQPVEVKDYDVEYQDWLVEGDAVADAQVSVSPVADLAVDAVYVVPPNVNIWLSGGVHGDSYKITVTMTTVSGRVRQDEFRLKIKEY